jgi:S-adenosylmethionine uptake transporter
MTPNLNGALLMMGSMAAFTFNDTLIKMTEGAVPLSQLLVLRGGLSSLLILGLVIWLGSLKTRISSKDWGLIAIRSASEVAAAYAFITALLNMPLANVTAVLQVLPLTVTLGAAVVFKEQIGWRRMTAILIGFAGMLLIVRPGPDGFNIYAGYALLAVASVTVRDLVTRRLSKDVPSMMVTLAAAVIVTAFAGILSLGQDWVPVSNKNAGLIVGSSFFILGAYLCSVLAMRVGDISFTAPFRYTGLIWALILGWVIFGDWPTPLTMLGAAIVVGTGLFTLYRERALLRG